MAWLSFAFLSEEGKNSSCLVLFQLDGDDLLLFGSHSIPNGYMKKEALKDRGKISLIMNELHTSVEVLFIGKSPQGAPLPNLTLKRDTYTPKDTFSRSA